MQSKKGEVDMKAQIFIDPLSKRIIAINTNIDDCAELNKDNIYIDEEDTITVIQSLETENLFFIDGKITKEAPELANSDAEIIAEYEELNKERYKLEQLVGDEYKILMDKIISGVSMEQAAEEAKNNREKLESILKQLHDLEEVQKEIVKDIVIGDIKTEEENIDYKYYSSILLLIRDENEYIEEWINHFINTIGVDHIYIYDNESSIPVEEYLEAMENPYLDRITFVRWKSTEKTQEDANNHFLLNYRDETRWVAPIDTDEFIQINDTSKSLNEFLKENEDYASILCEWVHYNANGHEKKTKGGVLERFTKVADWYKVFPNGKRFIQTNRCNGFTRYNPELRAYCSDLDSQETNKEFFQLNHYITRSFEEWNNKMSRGSCDPNVRRKYQLFFELNPDMEYLNNDENFYQGYGPNTESSEEGIQE